MIQTPPFERFSERFACRVLGHPMGADHDGSAAELAAAEKVDPSYLGRVLRLTLLAPDLIEAILDERLPSSVGLTKLMRPFPVYWNEQFRPTARRIAERHRWFL